MKINLLKFNFLFFFVLLALPVFQQQAAAQSRVVDNAGLLSAGEAQRLSSLISAIASEYRFDLVIVTERNIGSISPVAYADDYFDNNGYGFGAGRDGCVLLQVTDTRDIIISTSGSGVSILNASAENKVFNDVIKRLRTNNYYEAYNSFLENWREFLALDAKGGRRFNFFHQYNVIVMIIAWLISFGIGFIVVASWKSNMNTVFAKTQAAAYAVPGSLNFSEKSDTFLYSTVAKTPRASGGSSGGNAGGPRVSSSGNSHGGGGRKY